LGIAAKTGSLHRNFQGYCTRETTGQVYAFGSSAISQLDNAYLQNTKNTSEYIRTVRLGLKTEIKVHELSVTEKMYRDMIERLMCNHSLKVSAKEKELLGNKWGVLCALAKDELVEVLSDHEIVATELGRLVIRFVASKMDPLLDSGANNEGVFSKTI
jgi:oxygen-independent coproporphyrinogen-3 oxidase